MKTTKQAVKLLFILFASLVPAQLAHSQASQAKPKIVATISMIADIARNVAGDRCDVVSLMGEGVDPHLFKPTRSDIAKLVSADIVFYNGLLLEGKMTDALIRVASAGKKVFAVTELLPKDKLLEPEEFNGHYDPHVWMDPVAWKETVRVVRDQLIAFDAEGKASYTANAEKYLAKLDDLDSYARRIFSEIPVEKRILVTAHDAFNYFGQAYGFTVFGIQGLSTESEAGVKDIEEIVQLLVTKKVPAVFVESTVSDRNIKALVEGAAAKDHRVTIGGKLFSDAMGTPGSYRGTYIGMIDHNVTTIARALGVAADPKGFQGLLTE